LDELRLRRMQKIAGKYLAAVAFSGCLVVALATFLWTAVELPLIESPERAKLRTMIGQMLIIGFPGASVEEEWPRRVAAMIGKGEIGGVLLLADNIRSPAQLKTLTDALEGASRGIKPFIAVDQEGGAVQRLPRYKGFLGLPAAQTVALSGSTAALVLYTRQAQELAALGITVNLGPVLDLNVNPDNPIIAGLDRSYGETAEGVAAFGRAFVESHLEQGILTAAKHFPGHGSSAADPHQTTADISASWRQEELVPFKLLATHPVRVPMIMVGHLILDDYSDGQAPASLSRRTVTGLLRNELGYEGLIITDDLDMAAVRSSYGVVDAAVRAAAAGNDLILAANMRSPDAYLIRKVTKAIVAAVERGEIDRQQIERSYNRILAAKSQLARLQAKRKPVPFIGH
jgi:beta-N-acetylhexosaminidase